MTTRERLAADARGALKAWALVRSPHARQIDAVLDVLAEKVVYRDDLEQVGWHRKECWADDDGWASLGRKWVVDQNPDAWEPVYRDEPRVRRRVGYLRELVLGHGLSPEDRESLKREWPLTEDEVCRRERESEERRPS